jgi:3-oxoacyl-[acyl-carrier protein] reductase
MLGGTPEGNSIFSATYDPPDHLWLSFFFAPSAASQAAGRAFLKRFRLRSKDRDPEVSGEAALAQRAAIAKWSARRERPYDYLKVIQQPTLIVNGSTDVIIYTVNSFILQQHAVAADLERADGPHKLAKIARDIVGDRLDILVANAGVSKSATIEDTTIEDFDRLFAVNVRAPFFLVQQLLPILSKGSSIVLVASLAARGVVGTIPAYAATKGAIDTLVKHFASLLGARGIRVNAVAPGVVETEMSNFTKTDGGRDFALGMQALKRLAQPDDIGGVVAFLASEDARWVTGDTIHVDGGSKL